MHMTPLNSGRT